MSHQQNRYQNNLLAWEEYRKEHAETPFIEGQNDMQKLAYGGGFIAPLDRWILGRDKAELLDRKKDISASKNACEVIALYNGLLALYPNALLQPDMSLATMPVSHEDTDACGIPFPDLLLQFEKKGILFGGLFGTSMKAVFHWLSRLSGIDAYYFSSRKLRQYIQDLYQLPQEETREFEVFLVSFWNRKGKPWKGIHTICVTKDSNETGHGYVLHNLYENNRIILCDTLEQALLHTNGESAPVCAIGMNRR